jgi:uncharacterized protein YbbK (DUF523 family)
VKPRVGISRCLLGDDVRYDGTNKRSAAVLALGNDVEWVPVCPELEVGMGVPREPIQLVAAPRGIPSARERVMLLAVGSGTDWTDRMHAWTATRVVALAAEDLSGFVLKARSPSCGPAAVLVHHPATPSIAPTPTGRGLFAEALAAALPELPLIDEESLQDPHAREEFMRRVRARADTVCTNT